MHEKENYQTLELVSSRSAACRTRACPILRRFPGAVGPYRPTQSPATLSGMVWKADWDPRWLSRLKAAAVVLVPLFIVGLAVWDACLL